MAREKKQEMYHEKPHADILIYTYKYNINSTVDFS